MYKLILIGVLLTNFSSVAFGQTLEGTMMCVVKNTSLQKINDGTAESFTAYKGGLGVGDSFSLTYSVSNGDFFKLDSNQGDMKNDENLYIQSHIHLSQLNTSIVAKEIVVDREYQTIEVISRPFDDALTVFLHMRKDSFKGGVVGESLISLRRYYKGDWMGMYIYSTALRASPITALVYSFDCKHSSKDNWLEVFETLLKGAK